MRFIKLETIVGLFMICSIFVFLFMSFKIGIWRVDTVRYAHYIVYFEDVSGLNEKSDVMIAGVKIGWVQKLSLVSRNKHVRVDLMIDRSSIIYANASALIRQNGLLGTKYIDLLPGDPTYPILPPESTLMHPSKSSVSIDELLHMIKDIAVNINEVSASLKNTFSNNPNDNNVNSLINKANSAFIEIERAAEALRNIVGSNSEQISSLTKNFDALLVELRNSFPNGINRVSHSAEEISAYIKHMGDSVSGATGSFQNTMESFKGTAQSLTNTAHSVDSTLLPIKNVFINLEKGKGLLGSLLTDSSISDDIKSAISGIKDYFNYMDRIAVDLDMHLEGMQTLGNDLDFKDAKGYFNFFIRPSYDFYYIAGLTSSYYGVIKRTRTDAKWFDQNKHELIPANLVLDDWAKLWFAPVQEQYVREYDAITFNLQLAKEFGRLQFRAGLFESTFGVGVDYSIALRDNFRWITSLELYRWNEFLPVTLSGRLVYDIDMPNLKWYNRVFMNDSLYCVFGVDDILGKYNTSFFAGLGMFFQQDDAKYLASSLKLK